MNGPDDAVTPQAIARCERIIRPYIRRTPVMEIDGAEFGLSAGAAHAQARTAAALGRVQGPRRLRQSAEPRGPQGRRRRGFGRQSWRGGRLCRDGLGKPAKIFVPSVSSPAKIARIREYGADLRRRRALCGCARSERSLGAANRRDAGPCVRPERDHHRPGNVGLELDEQAPEIDTVLVAGRRRRADRRDRGLVRGPHQGHRRRAVCVADADQGFGSRHPVDAEGGGSRRNRWRRAASASGFSRSPQKYVPRTVLVTDDAIAEAQQTLWRALRIVAEPGGAAAFSAILSGAYRPAAGERVAVVISGGNTAAVDFDTR